MRKWASIILVIVSAVMLMRLCSCMPHYERRYYEKHPDINIRTGLNRQPIDAQILSWSGDRTGAYP